jgi:histone H1/5
MSDAVVATGAQVVPDAKAKTPKKKATTAKVAKKPTDHPKYSEMVQQALGSLKERGGSSRQAILKYIMKNFKVGNDEAVVNTHLKIALRSGVKNDTLKQSKGTGAAGSFRLGEVKKAKVAAKKSPAAAKKPTKAKTAKSPKKVVKKAAAAGSVKKPKTDKPAKKAKADKPKKATTPKKPKAVAVKKATAAPAKKATKADKPKKAASPAKKTKPVATKKPAAAPKAKKPAVGKKA